MGCVYRRKKSKFYWLKYQRGAKVFYESAKTTKVSEAKKLLAIREGNLAKGKPPNLQLDKITFGDLAKDFLTDYEINNKRLDRARLSVSHLEKFFGNMRAVDITTSVIQTYIKQRLGEGMSNSSINRELSALKRMFYLGYRQEPKKVQAVPYIRSLKESLPRTGFFSHVQYLSLLQALPSYLQAPVKFLYKSGWRKSEVTGLRWSQVDSLHNVVRLEKGQTKNKEGRTFFLDSELQAMFNQLWEKRKANAKLTPWVFMDRTGKGQLKDFRKAWASSCKKAGLAAKLVHDFRRTAIRNQVRAGVSESVAMKVSGHKTRSVFERYNIVSEGDLQDAAMKQQMYLQAQEKCGIVTV